MVFDIRNSDVAVIPVGAKWNTGPPQYKDHPLNSGDAP